MVEEPTQETEVIETPVVEEPTQETEVIETPVVNEPIQETANIEQPVVESPLNIGLQQTSNFTYVAVDGGLKITGVLAGTDI